jgi:leukotriene-A4 hydrolase
MKTDLFAALLFLSAALLSCESKTEKTMSFTADIHSLSKPNEAYVTHLAWKATVDFEKKIISAVATWSIVSNQSDSIVLDTKGLTIEKVLVNNDQSAPYALGHDVAILGQSLSIKITPDTKTVSIYYTTSPDAEALQWLSAQQTAGKKFPFLFTQSEAILARSWVPCQDSPGVKFTYDADVAVPKDLLALMSASNPQIKNDSGVYHFEMKQPISSYLFALSVGDIAFKSVSARTGVYAEPSVIDAAVWEFVDLEKMVAGAEELYGAYPWERYDLIVLPPSFPFGGMENPRLTFATPTILTGDRSLTSLVAHELAHSWSGNLVTNATWNDFWLNEGFTVYFEHRIMEKLYGADYSEMLASLALQDLKEEIKTMTEGGLVEDTKLKLDLINRNPDDGVTEIAYNKGYFFLRLIEEKYGRDKFDSFLKNYFSTHAFTSMDTDGFMKDIKNYYQSTFNIALEDSLFTAWIFTTALPAECPVPKSNRFNRVDSLISEWTKTSKLEISITKNWSTHEWLHLLNNLPASLSTKQMKSLDDENHFTASGNSEILCVWLGLAIKNNYTPAYPKLEQFLVNTGRRKFLTPLYTELIKTEAGKVRAKEIYQKARPNYHFVATNTMDKLLRVQL